MITIDMKPLKEALRRVARIEPNLHGELCASLADRLNDTLAAAGLQLAIELVQWDVRHGRMPRIGELPQMMQAMLWENIDGIMEDALPAATWTELQAFRALRDEQMGMSER